MKYSRMYMMVLEIRRSEAWLNTAYTAGEPSHPKTPVKMIRVTELEIRRANSLALSAENMN